MVLLSAVVCGRLLLAVAFSSLTVDANALFAFIPAVSLALIYIERREILFAPAYWYSAAAAYIPLTAAMLLSSGVSLSLLLFSSACIAAFGFCYGPIAARRGLFPLALLLAMTPLPGSWLDGAIYFLQHGSASATGWLFSLANIPFSRQGLVFALPRLDIEIAKECSSIRSSLVLLICGLVLGHLFLKSRWTKLMLAMAVVPVTIAKNGLRIFTLSTLGMYVDPSFLTGKLHRNGGVLFFALAFAALYGLIKLLQRFERASSLAVPAAPVSAVKSVL